jgi:predicted NAD-dependent protein-ADP-ribosyltransferase YbiA (DUF1768 family)
MLKTENPKEHQDLGRKVVNYDGKIWNQRKQGEVGGIFED